MKNGGLGHRSDPGEDPGLTQAEEIQGVDLVFFSSGFSFEVA